MTWLSARNRWTVNAGRYGVRYLAAPVDTLRPLAPVSVASRRLRETVR